MKNLFKEAQELFHMNDLVSSLETLNIYLDSNKGDIEALMLRARIHYRMQHWGEAMNDYHAVLDIDADNKEAKNGVEMARNILGYFTPDMFNP